MTLWDHTSLTEKVYFINKTCKGNATKIFYPAWVPILSLLQNHGLSTALTMAEYRLSNKGARHDVAALSVWGRTQFITALMNLH